MTTFQEAALAHASQGEPVFPIWPTDSDGTCACPDGKACNSSPGKHPLGALVHNGVKDATIDEKTIMGWANQHPNANLGRATTLRPTFDIDLPDVAALLRADVALPLQTELIRTPGRDGLHMVLATEKPAKGQNLYLNDGRLLGELKAAGGYTLVPPSTIAGKAYKRLSPDDVMPLKVDDPVAWLKKLLPAFGLELADDRPGGERAYAALTEGVIREGEGRHNAMKSYAGRIWEEGMSPEAFNAALGAVNEVQCDPPLPDDELRSIARWFLTGKEQRQHVREHLTSVVAASTNGATPSPEAPETPLQLPAEVWRPTFEDYRGALEGVTEAADEHHFAALATSIGAVLGRRVYVDYAYRLYTNLYTLSVGPAGSSKKTTALRLARGVVTRADEGLATQSSVGSGEGLLEALAEADNALGPTPMHRRLLLTQGEMGQLLAKARQDGSGTLMPLLMDVFDCPSVLNPRTRTKPITAYRPTLSIMAATTPAHLARYVQDADWYGGLGSRFFICIAEPKDPIPRPLKVDPSRFNSVIRDIHNAVERWPQETEFKLTDEAAQRWDAWYIVNKQRERELGDAADVVSRTAPYALKLGLIFAALENDSPVIEDGQIEAGIMAAEFAQGCALILLEEIGDSKTIKLEQRIVRKLTKEPGIVRRDLQRGVCGRNVGSAMFKQTVDAMLETGKVTMRPDGGLLVG